MSIQRKESTSTYTNSSRQLRDASCINEDPKAFDTVNWLNAEALEICRDCPVQDLCLETVNPIRTFYDGIAGGFLWLNGRALVNEYLALPKSLRPYANYRGMLKYLEKRQVADKQLAPVDHKINRCSSCGEWVYDRPLCATCQKGNG